MKFISTKDNTISPKTIAPENPSSKPVNRDLWVAEINSASGMAADKMARVYIMIYEDFYKESLPEDFKNYLKEEYIDPVNLINVQKNGAAIKKSKGAIDYFALLK